MKQGIGGTKPYKNFHPRQAARGTIPFTTPTNFGTCSLFHNGPANTIIMLRDFQIYVQGNLATGIGAAYQQKRLTGTPGTVAAIDPSAGTVAGLVDYSDQAVALTYDWLVEQVASTNQLSTWFHEFPFAMLLPGWSISFQNVVKAKAVSGALVWEVVDSSQVDY